MEPKFKPGDKVRVVRKREDHWNKRGLMDHWLGKVMTIKAHNGYYCDLPQYYMEEGIDEWEPCGWTWTEDCLELADEIQAVEETDLLSILEVM